MVAEFAVLSGNISKYGILICFTIWMSLSIIAMLH